MFSFLSLLALASSVYACGGDGHTHTHARRSSTPSGLTPPTRPLQWGDINFIHTTDTHGWLLGHQKTSFPEPNYSGDLGDFASFVSHMKEIALQKDVDLLLIDSGDLHDGTGSPTFLKQLPYDVMAIGNHELYIYANTLDMHTNFAPALNGRYLSSNVNITTVDANNNTIDVPVGDRFAKFTTRKGKKVTAFGVLFDFTGNDHNTTVQKVEDMVKEEWFTSEIAEEPDFFLLVGHMPVQRDNWPLVFNAIRAVHPETPIFIFGGHTHIRDCVQLDNRSMSLESGRYMETVGWMSANVSSSTSSDPISFSRRYLDTNRFTYQFHTGTSDSNSTSSSSSHYPRSNSHSGHDDHDHDHGQGQGHSHSSSPLPSFDTPLGLQITQGLNALSDRFNLSFQFGVAPSDFTINQVAYPSSNSILTLMGAQVLPFSLTVSRSNFSASSSSSSSSSNSSDFVTIEGTNTTVPPFLMLTNSGSLRFDIYAGPFTKNDQLTASPFADAFNFIPGVEWGVALGVRSALDEAGEARRIRKRDGGLGGLGGLGNELEKREEELYRRGDVRKRYMDWMASQVRRHDTTPDASDEDEDESEDEDLTLGYVTTDSCPGIGDDTLHTPLKSFDIPDFISSDDPFAIGGTPISQATSSSSSSNSTSSSTNPVLTNSTLVDLVFVDFIQDQLLGILNSVQAQTTGVDKTKTRKEFGAGDVRTYSTLLSTEVLGVWAIGNW
ncbi:Metallo-dependent phosphatase [Dendrothele bispora CBS 962.96]|uniref:Metallo-dependent phosphatase n=1 Tax=Dendrothele bispora (strain CBS 962.96) TaxID=1314807 RepID=A0A4S8KRX3_DENBC|nr:Metallo-dependent phosphatase [Dendrothele bispora CBS 962.96]